MKNLNFLSSIHLKVFSKALAVQTGPCGPVFWFWLKLPITDYYAMLVRSETDKLKHWHIKEHY